MKKQLTFYFIRHGKTVWNTEGLMQGHGDSPLTEEGINGAKKTGVALNNIPFIVAYSSILKRTIEIVTMQVYLNYVNGLPRQIQRKALNFLS